MRRTGAITSILFLVFALVAFVDATKLPFGKASAPQPGFFPLILSVLLGVLSLLLLVEIFKERDEASNPFMLGRTTWKKIGLALGGLFSFALFFEILGYLVTTFLFITFLLRAVDQQRWRLAFTVAFWASLLSYLLFGLLLQSPLPSGILPI